MSEENKTVIFVYQGMFKSICCPPNASYEIAIEFALREFGIPLHIKDFIRITSGGIYPITKEIFEWQLQLSSTPSLEFHIHVDMHQPASNCIKFVYNGDLKPVYYSATNTFDDIIDSTFQQFSIPNQFKGCMSLLLGGKYPITPETLQYQLEMCPTPEMEFHIQLDHAAMVRGTAALDQRPECPDDQGYSSTEEMPLMQHLVKVGKRPCDNEPEQQAKRQKIRRPFKKSG